jgi:hypothetical protein
MGKAELFFNEHNDNIEEQKKMLLKEVAHGLNRFHYRVPALVNRGGDKKGEIGERRSRPGGGTVTTAMLVWAFFACSKT